MPPRSPMVCRGDKFGPDISPSHMSSATLQMPSDAVVDGFVARHRGVQAVPLDRGFSAVAEIQLIQAGNSSGQCLFTAREIPIDTRLHDLSCGAFTGDHWRTGGKSAHDVGPICLVDAGRNQQSAGVRHQLSPMVVADFSDIAHLIVVYKRRDFGAEPALLTTPYGAGEDERYLRRPSG